MKFVLVPFNANPAIPEIRGTIRRDHSSLSIDFADIDAAVDWPEPLEHPGRRDNLWQTTCFECFVGTLQAPYLEVNASPSGEWQGYHFTDYRTDSKVSNEISVIAQSHVQPDAQKSIHLSVDISDLEFVTEHWKVSLSAVLQIEGELSYFASHHPGDRPDFHLKDLRCLDLPYRS